MPSMPRSDRQLEECTRTCVLAQLYVQHNLFGGHPANQNAAVGLRQQTHHDQSLGLGARQHGPPTANPASCALVGVPACTYEGSCAMLMKLMLMWKECPPAMMMMMMMMMMTEVMMMTNDDRW
eukprot:1476709-Amphidinium_carterae.1